MHPAVLQRHVVLKDDAPRWGTKEADELYSRASVLLQAMRERRIGVRVMRSDRGKRRGVRRRSSGLRVDKAGLITLMAEEIDRSGDDAGSDSSFARADGLTTTDS
eukprot:gene1913-18186_t